MTFKYLGFAGFKGEDKSCGFRYGYIYEVRVYTRMDGKVMLFAKGIEIPYKNKRKFLENWELIYGR